MVRTFKVSGAVRQPVVARRAPRAAATTERVRAIMDAPGLSSTARQAMVDAALAGAVVDLPRTSPRMPGIEIGAGLRAHASPTRALAESRPRMPGIRIGGQAPRVHTGGRMPGLTLPVG